VELATRYRPSIDFRTFSRFKRTINHIDFTNFVRIHNFIVSSNCL